MIIKLYKEELILSKKSINLVSDSVPINLIHTRGCVTCTLFAPFTRDTRDTAWLAWAFWRNVSALCLTSLIVRSLFHFAERPDERRRMREPRRIRNCTWRRPLSRGSYRSWTWGCSWTYRPAWITTNGWRRIPSHCSTILISFTARYPSSVPWRAVPTWPVPA